MTLASASSAESPDQPGAGNRGPSQAYTESAQRLTHPDTPAGASHSAKSATMNLTVTIGPLMALIAGILILIVPRLLNYIVAIYLILVGLLGLFGGRLLS